MSFLNNYFKFQEEYQSKYGSKTIVLCQKGPFYEIYQMVSKDIGKSKEAADILNIKLTRTDNKKPLSDNNPHMIGFPMDVAEKFQRILLENLYTVVIVDQDTNEKTKREVTSVLSPGTNLDDFKPDSNYVMALYMESITKEKISYNLAGLDTKSGKIVLHSSINLDDVYRFIYSYYCTEIIIYLIGKDFSDFSSKKLIVDLNLGSKKVHIKLNEINKIVYKPDFQNRFLAKIYQIKNMLSPIENLELSKEPLLSVSLVLLFEFIYDHDQTLLNKVKIPDMWTPSSQLILDSNSLHQLHIIPSPGNPRLETILSVLRKTVTHMGYRLLRSRLTLPITDKKELNRRYQTIEWALKDDRYLSLRGFLKNIIDISRLHRKISMGKFQPSEFDSLDTSYKSVVDLLKYLKDKEEIILNSTITLEEIQEYIKGYSSIIDLDRANINLKDITESIFIKGVYPEIDKIDEKSDKYLKFIYSIQSYLNSVLEQKLGSGKTYVKLLKTDKDGYYLTITDKRLDELSKLTDTSKLINISSGKTKKIVTEAMQKANNLINNLREQLRTVVINKYQEFIAKLSEKYHLLMNRIVDYVAELDLIQSQVWISIRYKYCRPLIMNGPSYIKTKEIRHPIIERLLTEETYVENDLEIGLNQNGILLFSINGAGKSSMMRTIGVNLIMAQAGFFVASSEFFFSPFNRIMTRLTNDDNLHQGKSSFNVEMLELKSILERADDKTLVLGDEICRGTEHVSGLAIIAAAIKFISKRKINFIFATHMHSLTFLEDIKEISNLSMFHLRVEEVDGKLVYYRKLVEGSGPKLYGIEVCKAMGLPAEFISEALKIRREFEGESFMVSHRVSRYNSQLVVDICTLCGNKADHVHHIKFQKEADKEGFIGPIHKNSKANLAPVCQECHHKIHSGEINLEGYKLTNQGIKLL